MVNTLQRSHIRPEHEPRAVKASNGRTKVPTNSRRLKDNDDRDKHRSKRNEAHRPAKKDTSHRRKISHTLPSTTIIEQPYFMLDMIGQPAKSIQLGMPVEASLMISLGQSSLDQAINSERIDTSLLFAVASLVTDNRHGERLPLEGGSLTGQKMFDSVHPIPEDCSELRAQNQPCRFVLGYVSFTGLSIRQAGTYRIRITLIQMSDTVAAGATSLLAIDSEPIKVERRGTGSQRRHQHICG